MSNRSQNINPEYFHERKGVFADILHKRGWAVKQNPQIPPGKEREKRKKMLTVAYLGYMVVT